MCVTQEISVRKSLVYRRLWCFFFHLIIFLILTQVHFFFIAFKERGKERGKHHVIGTTCPYVPRVLEISARLGIVCVQSWGVAGAGVESHAPVPGPGIEPTT